MPKYEVSLDDKTYTGEGVSLDIQDVGRVPNGGSVVVNLSEEQYQNIKDSDNPSVKIKKAAESTPTTWEEMQQSGEAPEEAPEPLPEEGGES